MAGPGVGPLEHGRGVNGAHWVAGSSRGLASEALGRVMSPGSRGLTGDASAVVSGRDRGASPGPLDNINAAKQAIVAGRPPGSDTESALDDLVLLNVLGEGSYGRVYRALWRGTTVACKIILLPAHMSGRERHERMAVMEAAISSSLSHPNIVQTYTYDVGRVDGGKMRNASQRAAMHGNPEDGSAMPGSSTGPLGANGCTTLGPHSSAEQRAMADADCRCWEIRLIQEYCEIGSLRDKLNHKAFFRRPTSLGGGAGGQPTPAGSSGMPASGGVGPFASMPPAGPAPPSAGTPSSDRHCSDRQEGHGRLASGAAGVGAGLNSVAENNADCCASPWVEWQPDGSGWEGTGPGRAGGGSAPAPVDVDLAAVLDTAIDVARAMAHLHHEGIVHADLKPRNVLLKGSTTDPRGFVAKVADFGLSMRLDTHETHVSNAFHGTLAYMAPETLLHGHVSRASDVYGFGILLFELYTSDTAFRGVPKALIGHAIAKENLRPVFPPHLDAPFEYQLLACRCWESNPEIRPEFDYILDHLKRMRMRLCAPPHCLLPLGGPGFGSSGGVRHAHTGAFADRWGMAAAEQQAGAGSFIRAGRRTGSATLGESIRDYTNHSATVTASANSSTMSAMSALAAGPISAGAASEAVPSGAIHLQVPPAPALPRALLTSHGGGGGGASAPRPVPDQEGCSELPWEEEPAVQSL
ncbi:hypothetical protein GPECTOR_5g382 [Gonium pectorale]|uniref:Protein kinase domain-containing protein n=1 Tax=Gonium pectorale TaxID=33097 RepID=A0A150GWM1_GONPE|nr:hypothetical protein GPECTOR_5g382 [Gonium pectorale]|eukprot:KXZ54296.1 hypothetical protein GPECTOR_5g382 [Gonium pectorale]